MCQVVKAEHTLQCCPVLCHVCYLLLPSPHCVTAGRGSRTQTFLFIFYFLQWISVDREARGPLEPIRLFVFWSAACSAPPFSPPSPRCSFSSLLSNLDPDYLRVCWCPRWSGVRHCQALSHISQAKRIKSHLVLHLPLRTAL